MIRRPLRPLARILAPAPRARDPTSSRPRSAPPGSPSAHRAERAKAETRLLLLGVVFILGFTTVAGRMALRLGLGAGRAARRRAAAEPIHAQRADIVDRNGRVLATNIVTASLYAQPQEMIDPAAPRRTSWRRSSPTSTPSGSTPSSPTGGSSSGSSARSRPSSASWCTTSASPGLLFGPRETRLYPERRGGRARPRRRELRARGRATRPRSSAPPASSGSSTRGCAIPAAVDEPLRLSIDLDGADRARGRARSRA